MRIFRHEPHSVRCTHNVHEDSAAAAQNGAIATDLVIYLMSPHDAKAALGIHPFILPRAIQLDDFIGCAWVCRRGLCVCERECSPTCAQYNVWMGDRFLTLFGPLMLKMLIV